jgi:predicted short-subunit dehydrogenase-like oxidoreductase (DUF2520 family)
MKPSVAIIGCGKVGTSLGNFLRKAGYPISGLASKSLSSAQKAARIIGTDKISDIPWEMTRHAQVVFITTPDNAIADTCSIISQNSGFQKDAVVLHCSGLLPSTVLSSAKTCGAYIGSLHPLQSFASAEYDKNPFKNIIVSVEGEHDAVEAAEKIAKDLGSVCYRIKTEAKSLYHASAVVASNYLVTLLELAFRLISASGIHQKDAVNVLNPLIYGTLSNIEKVGIPDALTGPIARGDIATVENHIKEIGAKSPDLLVLYKMLGFYTVDIARAGGTITKSLAQRLKRILT